MNFDSRPPDAVINNIEKICQIQIKNFTGTYTSSITRSPESNLSFVIDMNYSVKFTKGPVFELEIKLLSSLKQIDTFYFTKTKFSATLATFYSLNSESKKLVESSANVTRQGAEAAQSFMMIQNILNAGSSVAMKSLMLMEIIRLLRFIDVK